MNIHRIITLSSLWVLDMDSMMCTRVPLTEDPSHGNLSYEEVGKPEPFEGEVGYFDEGENRRATIKLVRSEERVHTGWIQREEFV